jgi:dipeptidyl aminopeptidase/acylaminoacyl peptidase
MVEDAVTDGTAAGPERLRAWFNVSWSSSPSFAYGGRELLFLTDASGLPQAARIPLEGGTVRQLHESRERVGQVDPCPTAPRAILAQDVGGNETWQLQLVSLTDESGRSRASRRALTGDPKIMNLPGRWMDDGRRYLYSSNARDGRYFDVYRVDVDGWSPAERILTGDFWQEVISTRGDRTLVARNRTNIDVDLLLIQPGSLPIHLNPHEGEQAVTSATIGPDAVYAGTDPDRELSALFRYPFDGSRPELVRAYDGDVELVRASPDGSLLAVVVNRDGWSELHFVATRTGKDQALRLQPRGVMTQVAWRPDGLALAYDLNWPNGHEIFLFDLRSERSRRVTTSPSAPPLRISEPRSHEIKASDGVRISYWEYPPGRRVPRGTILMIHGGPEGQARPTFEPELGFLVQQGWRLILPNVRGSTGYGRTFLHLDDVRKRMDSVRDVRDIAESLIRARSATRGRLGILGGSYGGFMVMSSITTYPELWGAAVELFGISNFVTFLERTADYRRKVREDEYGSLAKDRKFLESISPIHHLNELRTPLLVVHGRNDPRVPIHEAEQIVKTLQERQQPVDFLYFENEGHGFVRRENQIAWTERCSDFFDRYLSVPSNLPTPARRARRAPPRPTKSRSRR